VCVLCTFKGRGKELLFKKAHGGLVDPFCFVVIQVVLEYRTKGGGPGAVERFDALDMIGVQVHPLHSLSRSKLRRNAPGKLIVFEVQLQQVGESTQLWWYVTAQLIVMKGKGSKI